MSTYLFKQAGISRRERLEQEFKEFCAGVLLWRDEVNDSHSWDEADIAVAVLPIGGATIFTSLDEIEEYIIDSLVYPDAPRTRDFPLSTYDK